VHSSGWWCHGCRNIMGRCEWLREAMGGILVLSTPWIKYHHSTNAKPWQRKVLL
jgi:hypothetical protein